MLQRDCVLHRQLGARADGEVRRVRRVAHEHDVSVCPAPVQHPHEVEPLGAARVPRIADQVRAIEQLRKHALGEGDRLRQAHPVQAMREIGLLVALHDEGAHRVLVRIDMGLEPAVLGALECLHERVVGPVGAKPHVAALADFEIGPEVLGVPGADAAVDTVAGYDQIGPGKAAVVARAGDVGLVLDPDAKLRGAPLQDVEQALPVDAAHAVAAGDDHLAAVVDVDIVPVAEAREDVAVRLGHRPRAGCPAWHPKTPRRNRRCRRGGCARKW